RLQAHETRVSCVAFSPDGKLLASGSGDGRPTDKSLRVWDVRTGKELLRHEFRGEVNAVAFSHDGRVVAAGCEGDGTSLLEVATGKLLKEIDGGTGVRSPCIAFSPDGRTVASVSSATSVIRLWDFTTGKDLRELSGHKEEVWSVTFDAKGERL